MMTLEKWLIIDAGDADAYADAKQMSRWTDEPISRWIDADDDADAGADADADADAEQMSRWTYKQMNWCWCWCCDPKQ